MLCTTGGCRCGNINVHHIGAHYKPAIYIWWPQFVTPRGADFCETDHDVVDRVAAAAGSSCWSWNHSDRSAAKLTGDIMCGSTKFQPVPSVGASVAWMCCRRCFGHASTGNKMLASISFYSHTTVHSDKHTQKSEHSTLYCIYKTRTI